MDTKLAERKAEVGNTMTITAADIKNYFCPNATEKEVFLALGVCKSLGLNPHLKEVHFIKYDTRSPMQIITGYEVYLKRAERSGKLNGWKAWVEGDMAKIVIYRKDWAEPFSWDINIKEFNKGQSSWKTIPSFMAKKVAISQGFRMCFSDELGGMPYTSEEHEAYIKPGTPQVTMMPSVPIEAPKAEPKTAPNLAKPNAEAEAKAEPSAESEQELPFQTAKLMNVEMSKTKSGKNILILTLDDGQIFNTFNINPEFVPGVQIKFQLRKKTVNGRTWDNIENISVAPSDEASEDDGAYCSDIADDNADAADPKLPF
jgi:phage recombination protein Bet